MKILSILIMSLLMGVGLGAKGNDYFANQAQMAYGDYDIVCISDSSDEYELSVVAGLVNGEKAYGVYFYTKVEKYAVISRVNNEVYEFPIDNDGSVWSLAVKYEELTTIEIFDASQKTVSIKATIDNDVYTNLTKTGENKGTVFTKISSINERYNRQIILYVSLAIVITLCFVVLAILRVTHTGMFAKARRAGGGFNMQDFLQNSEDESDPYDPLSDIDLNDEDDLDTEKVEEKQIEEKVEEPVQFDIKQYLMDKGFITTYESLSEEEKNSIMLELMMLRKQGKISESDYKKETVQLWKK